MKKFLILFFIALFAVSCGKKVESSFTMSKNEISLGESVQFISTSSDDAIYYHWTFGDGGSSRDPRVTYTFSKAGIFQVRLHVTNPGGDYWDDAYQEIRVNGYNNAFINHWAFTETYTSDSCAPGSHLYQITIRNGDKPDEVWVDNFADNIVNPVKGRTPYGNMNKIEFTADSCLNTQGEFYYVEGNMVLSGSVITLHYTMFPQVSPTLCGIIIGDGTGITF